jgi:hypothetical protein
MDNLYDVLIGEAPTDADKAAATAAALRRRRAFGELGVLSGDRVLSNYGRGAVAQADDYANRIQQTRQQDIDNAQTKSYQTGQLDHMGNVLKESVRSTNMRDATTRRGQDLALLAAQARARAANKPPKLTVSDRRDLTEGAGLVGNMNDLLTTFKDDYAAPQVFGKSVPGARPLSNTLSAMGLGSKDMDEAQKWWAASDRLYTLFNRNKMFGATLTSNEMKAWAEANASKNMKPTQVKAMLKDIMRIAQEELQSNVDGFVEGGYDTDQIDALTQRALPRAGQEIEGEEEIAEPGMEEDFGDLTPEEIEELEALRSQFRGSAR